MSFAVTSVSASGTGTPSYNLQEIVGTTVSVNNGTADAGTQRVAIASDNTPFGVLAAQSGSWSVGRTWTLSSGTDTIGSVQSGAWSTGRTWTLASGSDSVSAVQSGTWNIGTVSGAVTVIQPTAANLNATVVGTGTFSVQATQAGTWTIDSITNTVTIAGSVTANQGGTWNINNITGTVSLPTGAATETTLAALNAKIPSGLTVTSTRLLVDGSGVTQPISGSVTVSNFPASTSVTQGTSPWVVSGTVAATQSGTWSVTATQTTAANLNATVIGTGTFAVQAAQSGTWSVAQSGTWSVGRTWTLASGTDSVAAVQSGTWNIGTLTTITNPVTVAQATAANLNATVVGTGTFAVQAAQSGTWNINSITNSVTVTGTVAATQSGTWSNAILPSASSANAPTRAVTSAYAASLIVKASAGNLYAITGYNSKTSAQFIQVHNSTTVPADTAVPIYMFTVPATSNFSLDFGNLGEQFSTGIVVCNSSTGPTKNIGAADCWFTVRYQ